MKATLAAALIVLVASAPAAAQPNIVVVVTDDQRDGTLSPALTPAIWAQIRERGVLYQSAAVPTSVCCPSRASILTGLYSHSTGVYGNLGRNGGWPAFAWLEQRTVATALHDVGYRTGLVGKYLNYDPNRFQPYTPSGWDAFVELRAGYYDYRLSTGETFGDAPEDYSTDVLRDRAVQFIAETPPDQPLFLYFAPWAPHLGAIPAPRHQGALSGWKPRRPPRERNMRDKPPWLRRLPPVNLTAAAGVLRRSQESLLAVDDAVAAIVAQLEAQDRMDNTLLVFLSDNGILYGEHRVYNHKNLPYRAATDVPMVARWDNHLAAGGTVRRPVLNVDLATTISRAASAAMPTEGLDLLGPRRRSGFLLEGQAWRHRRTLRVPAFCGWRTTRYTYVRYNKGRFEELYDLRRDPHELRNQAESRRYRGRLLKLRQEAKAACRPAPPKFVWRH